MLDLPNPDAAPADEMRGEVVDAMDDWLLAHLSDKCRRWLCLLLDYRWGLGPQKDIELVKSASHYELHHCLQFLRENGLLRFSRRYGYRTSDEGLAFTRERGLLPRKEQPHDRH